MRERATHGQIVHTKLTNIGARDILWLCFNANCYTSSDKNINAEAFSTDVLAMKHFSIPIHGSKVF
jgi:hypothetical protein